jgi:hypothetical protein
LNYGVAACRVGVVRRRKEELEREKGGGVHVVEETA